MSISYWVYLRWLIAHSEDVPRLIDAAKAILQADSVSGKCAALAALFELLAQLTVDMPIDANQLRMAGSTVEIDRMAMELNAVGLNSEYREIILKILSLILSLRQE